jgi:hypothetical protein
MACDQLFKRYDFLEILEADDEDKKFNLNTIGKQLLKDSGNSITDKLSKGS